MTFLLSTTCIIKSRLDCVYTRIASSVVCLALAKAMLDAKNITRASQSAIHVRTDEKTLKDQLESDRRHVVVKSNAAFRIQVEHNVIEKVHSDDGEKPNESSSTSSTIGVEHQFNIDRSSETQPEEKRQDEFMTIVRVRRQTDHLRMVQMLISELPNECVQWIAELQAADQNGTDNSFCVDEAKNCDQSLKPSDSALTNDDANAMTADANRNQDANSCSNGDASHDPADNLKQDSDSNCDHNGNLLGVESNERDAESHCALLAQSWRCHECGKCEKCEKCEQCKQLPDDVIRKVCTIRSQMPHALKSSTSQAPVESLPPQLRDSEAEEPPESVDSQSPLAIEQTLKPRVPRTLQKPQALEGTLQSQTPQPFLESLSNQEPPVSLAPLVMEPQTPKEVQVSVSVMSQAVQVPLESAPQASLESQVSLIDGYHDDMDFYVVSYDINDIVTNQVIRYYKSPAEQGLHSQDCFAPTAAGAELRSIEAGVVNGFHATPARVLHGLNDSISFPQDKTSNESTHATKPGDKMEQAEVLLNDFDEQQWCALAEKYQSKMEVALLKNSQQRYKTSPSFEFETRTMRQVEIAALCIGVLSILYHWKFCKA